MFKVVFFFVQLKNNTLFCSIVVTIAHYRRLNGLILRNASTLYPWSDLHTLIMENSSLAPALASILFPPNSPAKPLTKVQELLEHIADLYCITGTGVFMVHNCMNHSCEPNVVTMSNTVNHTISVVSIVDKIKQYDEICISYIDESEPLKQRRAALKQKYMFDCHCSKCQREEQGNK